MSTNRYPDNNRYPRDRSPPYRDRRPSNFGGGAYPARASDSSGRPNPDPSGFPPRDPPRGPKSLGDPPRGPAAGPPSSAPSAPRDGRGRGFAGRGEDTPLRTAPPLSSGPALNSHSSWRADRERDRDREFDRRERRPTPPRRSPIRESRDPRDQRDFAPRDLDINRARRNSRDGPPSAGSTYSDTPLGAGSSYRSGGIGRGRGGRDFAGRGRPFHTDDRDRHHDLRERAWRPRSRSPPSRRERDPREERRDERELDRRDRDDRRFVQREYDSYIGPAGAAKPGPRILDTHRSSGQSDSRFHPGTPTGSAPHSSHHASPSDRVGPQVDSYSRRASLAIDPSAAKREPGKDEALLASRAEASRERYAPRASSPPAAVPAFGYNVWRAPAPDAKPSTAAAPQTKSVVPAPSPATVSAPVTVSAAPVVPTAPKASVPSGLMVAPPTGPKADRTIDRSVDDSTIPEHRLLPVSSQRTELSTSSVHSSASVSVPVHALEPVKIEARVHIPQPTQPSSSVSSAVASSIPASSGSQTASFPSAPTVRAKSPPQGPALKPRPPPVAPQAAFRANASPQFSRAPFPPYAPRDASPSAISSALGPRIGATSSVSTSPKSLPANIPTGPKADRTPMAPRPPPMYPPAERPAFSAPRAPIIGGPKSMQWVRPGLMSNRSSIPTKREYPNDDRDRSFGTAPKAPRLEANTPMGQQQGVQIAKSESPSFPRTSIDGSRTRERAASAERPVAPSPRPSSIETRRHSDVFMADASPRLAKPPVSAASSGPEALQDSDDDVDLDDGDFAGSEAKYNRERELLQARKVDLSAPHLRAVSPLHEAMLLHCLTIEHQYSIVETCNDRSIEKDVPIDVASTHQVEPSREDAAPEPLTPEQEDAEDMDMNEKEEKSIAPATAALRLRHGLSSEHDVTPDLGSLPYLCSGPPTPLSDIEQERPELPETVMLAIREKLQKSIEPELSTDEMLQQYATLYRQWRQNTRPLDEERDQEDQERQPSAEPSLKATTPDVTTAAMAGLLEPLPAATGRRSHSSRWATELDLEQVIIESLKTAEEERMGKKEKEPRRALADPEKEADLPLEIVESEAQRRRYIDTNFQREPGQGIFVFHYEPPEDDFTEEEHRVMVQNYRDQYAKKWGKLAEILYKEVGAERTYKDTINHYYATKWGREYKGKLKGRRKGVGKRGGGVARGRAAIANMERPDPTEDGMPLPLTETGRPRRSAAPTFGGMETDFDPATATPTPGRARRQTDADGTQEKVARRGKTAKDKVGRKAKNPPLAAAPVGSPAKLERKEKGPGVKTEDDYSKRLLGDMSMPIPIHTGLIEDHIMLSNESSSGMPMNMMDRPRTQATARPGPSSYWSVSELQDFDKNVSHFGTDWLAISNHMGTKTHTMIKNQYLRLIESGRADLEQVAQEADARRERGDHLGPPPTPTPAPKRRYESTQTTLPRQIAPTPELHKSPLLNSLALQKTTPPQATTSSRFSTIAQAPAQGKPLVTVPGFPSLPEPTLASIPSMQQRQSPPAPPQRSQLQQNHSLSQHKQQHPGPRAGFFSDEVPSRHESRPPSQSSHQTSRILQQQHVSSANRTQEQHQPQLYRSFGHHERETRLELQQEHEAQHRHQQHSRRISQELNHHRAFGAGGVPPLAPPVRSNSGLRSPEHRPLSYSHSRHPSQAQSLVQPPAEMHHPPHNNLSGAQQLPPRSTMLTPPVKDESRNAPPSVNPQTQSLSNLSLPSHFGQPPAQSTGVPPAPKPAAEPRKSNLMSLLNDTESEDPRRKKTSDQGPSSHTTTPQQQAPIAPPPPPPSSQARPSRRVMYEGPAYGQPSYAQQSSLPPSSSGRTIDLTSDAPSSGGGRLGMRDGWPQRQQYQPNQSQAPQAAPISSHIGLSQPPFGDSRAFNSNHRAVFAQHNTPRHNPSPPPGAAYNSPHMHSRTPSISGAPGQLPRHGVPSTTAPQHASTPSASAQILQPNPYAQVDPPGSSAPSNGPMGMRPSPHLRTTHIALQRESSGRNEHSQSHNASLSYSNPQTPNEHSVHQPPRGSGGLAEPYRPRDPRDFESRHPSDRDTGRELAHRADVLHEQMSNSVLRSHPIHEDMRYQSHQQDRAFMSQRSHTPLSRPEHSQPPPLQHPPHSSLGTNNQPFYGQRPPEESAHHFAPRSLTERIREGQAQQQAAIHREEFARREGDREREMQMRDAQMRESLIRRGEMRGALLPASLPGPGQEQRPLAGPNPGTHDWASAVRHPHERHPNERQTWQ